MEEAHENSVSKPKKIRKEQATRNVEIKNEDDSARLIAQLNRTQKSPKLKKLVIAVPKSELPQKSVKGIESEKRLVVLVEKLDMAKYTQKGRQQAESNRIRPRLLRRCRGKNI